MTSVSVPKITLRFLPFPKPTLRENQAPNGQVGVRKSISPARESPFSASSSSSAVPASTSTDGTSTSTGQRLSLIPPAPRIILRTGKRKLTKTGEAAPDAPAPKRKCKRPRKLYRSEDGSSFEEDYTQNGMITKSGRTVVPPSLCANIYTPPSAHHRIASHQSSKRATRASAGDSVSDNTVCAVCHCNPDSPDNQIVFCDGCDAAYHQACHVPAIDGSFIRVTEKNWFCAICADSKPPKVEETANVLMAKRTGYDLTLLEKLSYLRSLPSEKLVALLLLCEDHAPSVPIYPANIREVLQDLECKRAREIANLRKGGGRSSVGSPIRQANGPLPTDGTSEESDDDLWEDDAANPGISHTVNYSLKRLINAYKSPPILPPAGEAEVMI